jgi:hypothetical protein
LPGHRPISASQRPFKLIAIDPESPRADRDRACNGKPYAVAGQISHVDDVSSGNSRSVNHSLPHAGGIDPVDHVLIMATGLGAKASRFSNPPAEDRRGRLAHCDAEDEENSPSGPDFAHRESLSAG